MTKSEIQDILDKHAKWLTSEVGGKRADLRDADLSGVNLRRVNLSRADLSRADLSYTDLRDVDLSYTDLRDADLRGAYLSGANLRGADLSGANLRGADLSYTDLRDADLSGAYLSGANLRGANLSRADLRDADLSGAYLSGTILQGIDWLAYIGVVAIGGKARAYKLVTAQGEGPFHGGINYLGAEAFTAECDPDVRTHCSKGINLGTFAWCLKNKQANDNRLLLMEFDVADAVAPLGTDGKFRVSKCRKVGECNWTGKLITVEGQA